MSRRYDPSAILRCRRTIFRDSRFVPFIFTVPILAAFCAPRLGIAQVGPREILDRATGAVEADSVAQLRAEWSTRCGRDPTDLAAVFGLATLARLTYDYDRADSLYSALTSATEGEEGMFALWARLGEGRSLQSRGHFLRAHDRYEEAAELAAGRDPIVRARALIRLAGVRARVSGRASALEVLESAEPLIPTEDLSSRAAYHCQHAVLVRSDDPWAGHGEGLRGAELAERAGDQRTRAACLHALARIHLRNGDTNGTLDLLRRADVLQQAARDRAGLAATLQWAGYLKQAVSDFGEARRLLHKAIAEAKASGNLSPAAWAYLSLSGIAARSGDLAAAHRYGERALEIFRERRDPHGELIARLTQVDVLRGSGRFAKAREIYLEVLAELEDREYDWQTLGILIALVEVDLAEREWEEAEAWLKRARDYAHARGMIGWERGMSDLYAEVYLGRGDLERAETYIDSALAKPEEGNRIYRYLVQRAELKARRGDVEGAESDLEEAADTLDGWRATLDLQGLRRYAFQLSSRAHDPDLRLATVISQLAVSGRAAEAFRAAERRTARSLLDQLIRADALSGTAGGFDLSVLRGGAKGVEAGAIAAELPEGVALLKYVTGLNAEPTTLFVVTREGLRAHSLPSIDSLAPRIERFQAAIILGMDDEHMALRLAADLLAPALQRLPAAVDHLIVVADGALHQLSFDLLRPSPGELLVERYRVTLSPSAAVARELWTRERHDGPARILVLADPRFETGAAERDGVAAELRAAFAEQGGLDLLPASRREARVVARYAKGSRVRLGSEASESFVKQAALDDFSILHFATHARVDDRTVSRTALALAPGDGEDGFLQPGEIAALKLAADLVVLSGCRTASGVAIHGEGVYGLTAPLLETGARSILATYWRVGDRAAADFVESFYDALAEGHPVGGALRRTKLEAIQRGVPTRDWAAFALVGDPFVRIPLRQPPDRRLRVFLMASALVALIGAAWLGWRKLGGDRSGISAD